MPFCNLSVLGPLVLEPGLSNDGPTVSRGGRSNSIGLRCGEYGGRYNNWMPNWRPKSVICRGQFTMESSPKFDHALSE